MHSFITAIVIITFGALMAPAQAGEIIEAKVLKVTPLVKKISSEQECINQNEVGVNLFQRTSVTCADIAHVNKLVWNMVSYEYKGRISEKRVNYTPGETIILAEEDMPN